MEHIIITMHAEYAMLKGGSHPNIHVRRNVIYITLIINKEIYIFIHYRYIPI